MSDTPTDPEPMRLGPGVWRLDPAAAHATFRVRHLWGLVVVRGHFERVEGQGQAAADGTVSGRVVIAAASLTTGNRQRDAHLRSPDFFDVAGFPEVVVAITRGVPDAAGGFAVTGTLEAAGHRIPLELAASGHLAPDGSVRLAGEVVVDRTRLGMTWGPLGIASTQAAIGLDARFTPPAPARDDASGAEA